MDEQQTERQSSPRLTDGNEVKVAHEGAIVHEEYSLRAKRTNRIARLTAKPALRFAPLNDRLLAKLQEFDGRPSHPARDIESRPMTFGTVPGEMMWSRDGIRTGTTYLYFHGGGFFAGSVNSYRRMLEHLARVSGARVVSVNYRQLPDVHLADTVSDAIESYESLASTSETPDQIVVAGDSAGGYLTFKVAELAKRRSLVTPAALVGFSPLLSLDPHNKRKAATRLVRVNDAYLPPSRVAEIRKRWLPDGVVIEGFADPFNAVDYYSSPTFLVASETEMLRPETEALATRLADRDIPVEFHVWRRQVHSFPLFVDFVPEAREAISDAVTFVEQHVPHSGASANRVTHSQA